MAGEYMAQNNQSDADFIVVGGGSAGAVIASRLSEDPAKRVLLIEAGSDGRGVLVEMPVGFAKMLGNPNYDWAYQQDPDPSINNRKFTWSAGKMLGGGSSINGQVFIRGLSSDFDSWAEQGATGWDYQSLLPYFRRMENWVGAPDQARGAHGPQTVSEQRSPHPLSNIFVDACREMGLPTIADYNATPAEGAFLSQASQRDGRRCSTAKAYLHPLRNRRNLQILTQANVERIVIEDGCAKGVVMHRNGKRETVYAAREVIICCGAMASPALLMRSGIGSAVALSKLGIPVVADIPTVGENLQEHPGLVLDKYINRPTLNSRTGPIDMIQNILQYYLFHKGPMASPAIQAMGYAKTRPDLTLPDVTLGFSPLAYDQPVDSTKQNFTVMPKEPGVFISAFISRPKSRGRVILNGDLQPHVQHQLLGDPADLETLLGAVKLIERLFKAPALAALVTGDRVPNPVPANDEEWREFIRNKTNPVYHAAGTCRMGTDAQAVVDPHLRVRGIKGLRVADASIMPSLTSGNINAPTIMIGERAADLIANAA
jgi:choline dehydrogenase